MMNGLNNVASTLRHKHISYMGRVMDAGGGVTPAQWAETLNRPSINSENGATVMYCTSIESLTCPKVDIDNFKYFWPFTFV